MPDIPNWKLYNFVDTPVAITYSPTGDAQVPLDTNPIVDVTEFRQVSVRIGTPMAASWSLVMGKISGASLAVEHIRSVDNAIHTFDVVGPEVALWMRGGPPRSRDKFELWVYLRS